MSIGVFMDRTDEFLILIKDVERNILGRLSEQDVRLVRVEEGQKLIHKRIDDHMEKEEFIQTNNNRERSAQINSIHEEIKDVNENVKKIAGAEALNTGWRLYLVKTWGMFNGFLRWVGFATVAAAIWYAATTLQVIH